MRDIFHTVWHVGVFAMCMYVALFLYWDREAFGQLYWPVVAVTAIAALRALWNGFQLPEHP